MLQPPLLVLNCHSVRCLKYSQFRELVNPQHNRKLFDKFVIRKDKLAQQTDLRYIVIYFNHTFYAEECISGQIFLINNPILSARQIKLQNITWSTLLQSSNLHFHTLNLLLQFCYCFILFCKCTLCSLFITPLSLHYDYHLTRLAIE